MKPLIGIPAGEVRNALYPWGPIVYGQSYTYCQAVERAGGIPCIIPLIAELKDLKQLYGVMDGILFAGGNDIDPELYGEKPYPTTLNTSKRRDTAEARLMKWALDESKPILGICRGMQLLNVMHGGTLYQDIPIDLKNADDHIVSARFEDFKHLGQAIKVKERSKLAVILNKLSLQTNSLHHQAVKAVGNGLEAVAWAPDGVIEAIESLDDSFVIGMQCHPEALEASVVKDFRKLFESFVAACVKA